MILITKMNNVFNQFLKNKYFYAKVYFSGMALNTVSVMCLNGYIKYDCFVKNNLTYPEQNFIKTKTDAIIHGMRKDILIDFLWPVNLFKIFCLSGLILLSEK
jgi:hypothetical protein